MPAEGFAGFTGESDSVATLPAVGLVTLPAEGSRARVFGNLAVGIQPSEDSQFPSKRAFKNESQQWSGT
jgi:hypothetical protein